jgi:flavin-dependent dehydrogenase
VLDKILVDAAVASGAELREDFTVDELLWEGDRVVGIKGHGHSGGPVEERARIVIGADGIHSFVAKAVGAEEYDAYPPLVAAYYSYWSGFDADDIEQYVRPYGGFAIFPTNDDLTLIVTGWQSARFHEIREDVEGHVQKEHAQAPSVVERLKSAKREDKWYGTVGVPNYFRKPYGNGWALVGDAGYIKDFLTAQGISDAFIDAESLTEALDAGFSDRRPLEEALAEHHSTRDEERKPLYDFSRQLATLEPPPPEMQQLFGAMARNQEATNQFFSAITGATPMAEFFAPENMGKIFAATGANA